MNHDESAVAALLADYERALNAADTSSVMELYAIDSLFMPQHSPSSVGTESVRRAYEAVFDTIRLDVTFDVAEIRLNGSRFGLRAHELCRCCNGPRNRCEKRRSEPRTLRLPKS